jgi:hypothetical protein
MVDVHLHKIERMIWLGEQRGCLTDWLTQRWVITTGRKISLTEYPWLEGPIGKTRRIGSDFFVNYARETDATIQPGDGILPSIDALRSEGVDTTRIQPLVREFYEHTNKYSLDAWSEWSGVFAPFGRSLFWLFSKRLQQLNVPQHSLDTARGMESSVSYLNEARTGRFLFASWVRRLIATGDVIYAGAYSTIRLPGYDDPCVKVTFPLPNGNAIVVMRPQLTESKGLKLISAGQEFGEPGFYFTVHRKKSGIWARYVRAMQESIDVYRGIDGVCRADHVLRLFGKVFLRLHYAIRPAATDQADR